MAGHMASHKAGPMAGHVAGHNMAGPYGRPYGHMAGHAGHVAGHLGGVLFTTGGRTKEGGQSQKKEGGKASGWAPEIMPKHRKSLPNRRQQEPQGGGAEGAALLSSIW